MRQSSRKMFSLNIVGCGHVGRVLARLFAQQQLFKVQDILNRSQASSAAALIFVGSGRALDAYEDLRHAKLWMLAVSDDQILPVCDRLLALGKLRAGDIVFHCSGALAAKQLQTAQALGVHVASLHPVRSFADPQAVLTQFAGTFVSMEGDAAALAVLQPALQTLGAQTLIIDGEQKALYHAASVLACNYFTSLVDASLRTWQQAGIAPATARQLAEPLIRETLDNIFRLGPAQALTGPLARGDMQTVQKQQQALQAWDGEIAALYQAFTNCSAQLVARKRAGQE